MNVVLGVDGGGTRTRASIVAGEQVLAHAEGGSIKRLRVGAEAAEDNLRLLLKEVYAQAGLSGVRAASVGVASCSLPGTVEWITAVLKDFKAELSEVVGDEVIALDAAFRGGPGILQIAGTGSNTIGRAPDGTRECAGGYSSRLGDEGSGYWIGVNSVRRALHAYDREQPTRILEKVGEIWGTPSLDDLISLGDSTGRGRRPGRRGRAATGRRRSGGVCAAGARQAAPQALDCRRSSRGLDRRRGREDGAGAGALFRRPSCRCPADAGGHPGVGFSARRAVAGQTAGGCGAVSP